MAALSVRPIRNLLSPGQLMNTSFEPLHLVNTYGAFGSITRDRYEIVIEGTSDATVTSDTVWRAYEFKGKPGDPAKRPPQVAPYHLRLDWLMWFAAMSPTPRDPWFAALIGKLLEATRATLGLLAGNPFPDVRRAISGRGTALPVHDAGGAARERTDLAPRAGRNLPAAGPAPLRSGGRPPPVSAERIPSATRRRA